MHYVTRLDETPAQVIHGLSEIAGYQPLEVVALPTLSRGRMTVVRVARTADPTTADAVYISQGDDALFVASAIVLAHKHNITTARERSQKSDPRVAAFLNAFRAAGDNA